MSSNRFFAAAATLLAGAVFTAPAGAHFVWLSIGPAAGGREACLWFSETAEPGSAELVDRLGKAKVQARCGASAAAELKLERKIDGDVGGLAGKLTADGDAVALAQCDYGLFERGGKTMHLVYFAKAVSVHDVQELKNCAAACDHPLDVVARPDGQDLEFAVLWKGQPAKGAEVVVGYGADLEPRELKANDEGVVRVPAGAAKYAVRAGWVDPTKGELDGKPFAESRYYSTLVLDLPKSEKATAEASPTATEMLTKARHSRAVWDDFPGFRCDVKVHLDGELSEGELVVNADGSHELHGVKISDMAFLKQQLGTLLSHRLPDNQLSDEGAFPEGALEESHPLGTKVTLSNDTMGSAYRILDDVITEVNRDAGPMRFTISVLDVERNAENHYLPGTFAVDFWNRSDGQLVNSLAYHHRWKRVGTFDLPQRVTICNAGKDKRQVLRIEFADHQLLTK